MKVDEILQSHSMPVFSPSYPAGPYHFIEPRILVITYETDPELIRAATARAARADRPALRTL